MSVTALTIRGPFQGTSGHDHHVRAFVKQIAAFGIAVELRDVPHWSPASLPTELRDPWFDSLQKPCDSSIVLHFCMPHQVEIDPCKLNVNFTMFEADRVSPAWVARNRKLELLIVPTDSSRRAWLRSGMPESRIRLCPLGIDPTLYAEKPDPLDLTSANGEPIRSRRVRLLNIAIYSPRKNLAGLLEAWMLATTPHDDAALILKPGCSSRDRERVERRIRVVERKLHKTLHEAAPVVFIYDVFSDTDMPRLYGSATHYLSMSFGEGWDQPMLEAGASGLKLIAPEHSAYLAYLDSSIASLILSKEVPAVYDGDAETAELFRGACWWQPDIREAIDRIRKAINGDDENLAPARDRILRDFTWQKATERLLEILRELEPWQKMLPLLSKLRLNKTGKAADLRSRQASSTTSDLA